MNNSYFQSLLVIIITLATIGGGALANILPINEFTTGEVSALYPVPFTPAGYVFSIWSVIYLSLFLFSGYQLYRERHACSFPNIQQGLSQVKRLYVVSGILNVSWIVVWHYLQVEISVMIMLGLLGVLITIYQILTNYQLQGKDYWFLQFPFSLYLGWISVATVANITALFYDWGLATGGITDLFWTIGLIGMVTLLTHVLLWRKHDIVYGGVIIWSVSGILVANRTEPFLIVMALLAITTILYHMGRCVIIRGGESTYSTPSYK